MPSLIRSIGRRVRSNRKAQLLTLVLLWALPLFAQAASDPWSTSATRLQDVFTGTIAKALSLVAIVIGGLVFAYGEGGAKRTLAGIIFGCGMAVSAVSFYTWLFG